jgi:ankyrin repeat protein
MNVYDYFVLNSYSGGKNKFVDFIFNDRDVDEEEVDNYGNTILHYACRSNSSQIKNELLGKLKLHNRENYFGLTPLDNLRQKLKINVYNEQRLPSNFNLKFDECGEREGCNLVDINRGYMIMRK